MNHLYYGDNLQILREHIKEESVDKAPSPALWQGQPVAS
jgi:hypothetical protein